MSKSATKELSNLPTQAVTRIIPATKKLGQNPRPKGCEKLKGESGTWRMRIGDYRVIYSIDDDVKVVDARSAVIANIFTIET